MNKVYYHTFAPSENSVNIIIDYFKKCLVDNFFNKIDQFNVILTGDFQQIAYNEMKKLSDDKKINFIIKEKASEGETLLLLYDEASNEDKILYFHSKGVTQMNSFCFNNVKAWSNKLLYFLVDKAEDCLNFLDNYDLVGANYWGEHTTDDCHKSCNQDKKPPPHFSGNFWWTRGDYIKKLSRPENLQRDSHINGKTDQDPEFWIFSTRPIRIAAMSNIKINPYIDPSLFESYKDETPTFSLIN